MTARLCRSRSRFGRCGRDVHHADPHAVPVGDDVWFAYLGRGRLAVPLGYGQFVAEPEISPLELYRSGAGRHPTGRTAEILAEADRAHRRRMEAQRATPDAAPAPAWHRFT
jgi:hypothetical protein